LALHLERAAVCVDMGDLQTTRSDWQWCFEHLDDGTTPQVVALVESVRAVGDQAMLRALQLKMFAAGRVERLLREWEGGQLDPAHYRAYLECLPRSTLLPESTAKLLLRVDDERVRLHAVQQLIQRGNPLGPETIVHWVREGEMSDADAVAVLRLNAEFSAGQLEAQVDDPIVLRFYEVLAREGGDRTSVIRKGIWVRTDAGWGQIERIEDPEGNGVSQYIRGQQRHRLVVTLRPGFDAEPITVDLPSKLIRFPDAGCIYTCSKCRCFSSRDRNLIISRYMGHDTAAHGGIEPAYGPEKLNVRSLRTLEYSARKPKNELA